MQEQENQKFNHLKIHTQYSICEGAIKINDLKDFCKERKIQTVGLSDTSNLCGALEFAENISKIGTQPIIGTQINFKFEDTIGLLPLIALNNDGYKRIIELSSKSYLENDALSEPHCNITELYKNNKGVLILSGSIQGLFGKLFDKGRFSEIHKIYQKISSTFNGASIYYASKRRDDGGKLMNDTHHMLMPKGTAGRYHEFGTQTMGILNNSENIDVAKEYLKWWFQPANFDKWWRVQEGYQLHHVKNLANDPMWQDDPKMGIFKEIPKYGRLRGFAGNPNEKASLAASKYIIVDTFAKAVQSGDAKDALEWGERQLKRIYR